MFENKNQADDQRHLDLPDSSYNHQFTNSPMLLCQATHDLPVHVRMLHLPLSRLKRAMSERKGRKGTNQGGKGFEKWAWPNVGAVPVPVQALT